MCVYVVSYLIYSLDWLLGAGEHTETKYVGFIITVGDQIISNASKLIFIRSMVNNGSENGLKPTLQFYKKCIVTFVTTSCNIKNFAVKDTYKYLITSLFESIRKKMSIKRKTDPSRPRNIRKLSKKYQNHAETYWSNYN